jgi:hypothetical protein
VRGFYVQGIVSVCHHPHIHCLAPGGGVSPDNSRWIACRNSFFLGVKVLGRLFHYRFLMHFARDVPEGQAPLPGRTESFALASTLEALCQQAGEIEWWSTPSGLSGDRNRFSSMLHTPHRHLQPAANTDNESRVTFEGRTMPMAAKPRR